MTKTVTNERIAELLADLASEEGCTDPRCTECDTIAALRELLERRAAEPHE